MINQLPLIARRLLALGLLVLLLSAIWLAAVTPLIASYRENVAAIDEARSVLARYQKVADFEGNLEIVATQSRPDALGKQVLLGDSDAISVAGLQSLLQTITVSNNAQILSAQALPPQEAADYRFVGVRIDLTGDLAAIQHTLQKIETGQPFLFVNRATLRRREGAPENAAYEPIILDTQLDIYGACPQRNLSNPGQ